MQSITQVVSVLPPVPARTVTTLRGNRRTEAVNHVYTLIKFGASIPPVYRPTPCPVSPRLLRRLQARSLREVWPPCLLDLSQHRPSDGARDAGGACGGGGGSPHATRWWRDAVPCLRTELKVRVVGNTGGVGRGALRGGAAGL